MSAQDRGPGWDKTAVNRIAKEDYGSLQDMFEAHGWKKGEKTFGQIAPTLVKQSYGSINAFVRAHENGLAGNGLYDPMATINADAPNVWLTSYYGYDPENWGLLTFGSESDRERFIKLSEPGALVVIYGTKDIGTDEAGMVLGVQQVSHRLGNSEEFIAPAAWQKKQADPESSKRWNFAVQCTRAWHVVPENRPSVEEFASESYSTAGARAIGRYCKQITADEARKILDLEMYEGPVFGGRQIDASVITKGKDAMKPSRPGPVSQSGFQVTESEGPKHLYILELTGSAVEAFLERPARGDIVVKVGFSSSPDIRCQFFNKALPGRQFNWRVAQSTFLDNLYPFPTSHHAKAGEQAMVRYLEKKAESLGGEFFLASPSLVSKAWEKGKKSAREYKK